VCLREREGRFKANLSRKWPAHEDGWTVVRGQRRQRRAVVVEFDTMRLVGMEGFDTCNAANCTGERELRELGLAGVAEAERAVELKRKTLLVLVLVCKSNGA
jgi:hypothetical protein